MFRIYGIAPTQDGFVSYEDWRGALLPEELAQQEALLQSSLHKTGTSSREFHIRRRDDGQSRTIRSVETVRTDPDGQVQWVVGTNLDVTVQRQMQEDLTVAARRKDEFLATLAHELRNPLAPISNSLALMERANGNVAILDRARITMERQVAHMVRLIDDLLDVSRITRDQLTLKKERIELALVVNLAVETCQPHCERKAQELRVMLPPEPLFLHADATRLAQVLGNLLNNASKFTPKGGRIELVAERHGETAVVTVRDTGVGIEANMQSRVFELFTQVDAARNLSAGGLGIGLALAKRITELHGGSITLFSEGRDQGSEFVVQLPVMNEITDSAPAPSSASPASPVASRRVLVVDDNQDGAESLAALLALDGHEILMSHDGLDAVAKAASFRPDVVLLDIGLPKLDGYGVCRRIREQPGGKDIVMIAMTGWGQADDRRMSSEAGFDSHCVKPVSHALLVALMTQPRRQPG
jgi:signal transduction histidine kinase